MILSESYLGYRTSDRNVFAVRKCSKLFTSGSRIFRRKEKKGCKTKEPVGLQEFRDRKEFGKPELVLLLADQPKLLSKDWIYFRNIEL